jgi:branched-chain amino acid transport system substrate-binding protein
VVEAMKRADSTDPARFAPEIFNVSFRGATGQVEFDAKGDRRDAAMTIFQVRDGRIVPVKLPRGAAAGARGPAAS